MYMHIYNAYLFMKSYFILENGLTVFNCMKMSASIGLITYRWMFRLFPILIPFLKE